MSKYLLYHKHFDGHTGSIYALTSSNEHEFMTSGADGIIAKWDINNTNATAIAKLPHKVFCLSEISNSKLVAGTSSGGIYIIELSGNQAPRNLQFDTSICYNILKISEKHFLTAQESGRLIIWNSIDGSIFKSILLSDHKIRGLAHNETSIFVGTGEGDLVVLDKRSFKIVHQQNAHRLGFGVNAILHSKKYNLVVTGGKDGHLNFWDGSNYQLQISIPAHSYAIYSICADEESGILYSASRDKSIKVWNLENGDFIQKITREKNVGHLHSINRIELLCSDKLISVGDDKKIFSWKRA